MPVGEVDPDLEALSHLAGALGLLLVHGPAARHRHVDGAGFDAVACADRVLVDEADRAFRQDVRRDGEAGVRMRREGGCRHLEQRDQDERIDVVGADGPRSYPKS